MKTLSIRLFVVGAAAIAAACAAQTAALDREPRPAHNQLLVSPGLTNSKQFVVNQSSSTVTVYGLAANGNVQPLYRIRGSNTGLSAPLADGFDGVGQLYVLNAASIAVFAAGAKGDATPTYLIKGGLTQLSNPQGLAVDAGGKTYVTNSTGGQSYITAYAPGSNGDRAPVQTIYDGFNFFFVPSGIAVFGSTLYVADQGDQSLNEYAAASNGIVNPTAEITGLNTPRGVALDSQGLIYVVDSDRVLVYAATANGNAKPLRTISGSHTLLNGAAGLFVHNTRILVANSGNNSITVYPQTGNGDIPPLRQIIGANTKLSAPQDLVVH